jgi:PilZ domain
MDRREHRRVQLRLPARLRWTTPFGQKTEICETLNVSRGGLLVPCEEAHALGMPLWVTFPYDPLLTYPQPEVPAKVVRSGEAMAAARPTNGHGRMHAASSREVFDGFAGGAVKTETSEVKAAALRFEVAPRPSSNGNGHHHEPERRAAPRQRIALPIRVRLEHIPWFEETMTLDASSDGLRFQSTREYEPGQRLMVSFESSAASPWPEAAEFWSLVVRVDPAEQCPALSVATCRIG